MRPTRGLGGPAGAVLTCGGNEASGLARPKAEWAARSAGLARPKAEWAARSAGLKVRKKNF
jgi:hypothetical protein